MSAWRELTNDELFELSEDNKRRIAEIEALGATVMGVQDHYVIQLLEEIAGDRLTDAAREKHHLWLRMMLDEQEPKVRAAVDQLEAQQRTARILDGVKFSNGGTTRGAPGAG